MKAGRWMGTLVARWYLRMKMATRAVVKGLGLFNPTGGEAARCSGRLVFKHLGINAACPRARDVFAEAWFMKAFNYRLATL
jgi:hypothetical protein